MQWRDVAYRPENVAFYDLLLNSFKKLRFSNTIEADNNGEIGDIDSRKR